jgi:trk system potassium uptake protein
LSAQVIARPLGVLLAVLGATMGLCIPSAIHYGESHAGGALFFSMFITAGVGGGLFAWGRSSRLTVYRREALAVVGLGWLLIGLFGALPFYLGDAFTSFVDAYFETVSGFTTTGATVFTDIEVVPNSLLLWRMTTHWLGGMGIIVLFVAIFPQLGVGAKQMFRSEVPGPITEGLRPKIKETALALWKIYTLLTLAATVLLMLCGMNFFEALCHAFATLATGGYSTKNASIGHYDSVAIDIVITVFMFLAGINFSLYYLVMRGRFQAFLRNGEFRVYLAITTLVSLLVALDIHERHGDFLQALRYASFQTVAILTTTGFGTDNFDAYPPFSKLLLVCMMFVGGCAGSTAGGIKISRLMVIFKVAYQETYRVFRPQVRMSVRIGRSVVSEEIVRSILVFFSSFVVLFALGSIFMAALGLGIITASTSVAACLGNIGPGLARVGALENYAHIPAIGKIFLSFCMMLGRLELGTLLVLLVPDFWRR